MAADETTGQLPFPTRDEIVRRYKRSYKLRNPDADVGTGTQPDIDARTLADQLMVVLAEAQGVSDATNMLFARGAALNRWGQILGVDRPPASGSQGFVEISASTGGTTLFAGDELLHEDTQVTFTVRTQQLYQDGAEVAIESVDVGPGSNLPAGTVLKFVNPRPGCGPTCTVLAQSDGSGLTGGREEADDEEYLNVLIDARANPPAAGNDAQYQAEVLKTPGLAVQKAFSYPAVFGPGTTAVAFTMLPATVGGSRIPNSAQLAAVEAHLKAVMPADDGIFVMVVNTHAVVVAYRVAWRSTASGWQDAAPWPSWISGDRVRVLATTSPTVFTVGTTATNTTTPQVGQTIGVYDKTAKTFRRKRILQVSTVIANRQWAITCDATFDASDASYQPTVGQLVSPWSDSLDTIIGPTLLYFARIGPGEIFSTFLDVGSRQKRQPETPEEWPAEINNTLVTPVQQSDAVKEAVLLTPTTPYKAPVGVPGVQVELIDLSDLAAYAA